MHGQTSRPARLEGLGDFAQQRLLHHVSGNELELACGRGREKKEWWLSAGWGREKKEWWLSAGASRDPPPRGGGGGGRGHRALESLPSDAPASAAPPLGARAYDCSALSFASSSATVTRSSPRKSSACAAKHGRTPTINFGDAFHVNFGACLFCEELRLVYMLTVGVRH